MLNLEQNAARHDIEKGLNYLRLRHEFTENLHDITLALANLFSNFRNEMKVQ